MRTETLTSVGKECKDNSIQSFNLLLTGNHGTCGVVFGCLYFCFSESGVVRLKLSVIQPVSSQHPVSAVVAGTLDTCKQAQTGTYKVMHFLKRNF